jgi:alkylation response protein AidB-like acyl-CoA dehydrogenase
MSTLLSEEQLLLRESARDFLANEFPMTWVREWTEADAETAAALAEPLWKEMAELGWLGLLWPEACGGAELGFVEQTVLLEEMGRTVLPSPYLSSLIGATIVSHAADEETARETLTAVCGGDCILTFALVEQGSEDPAGFTTSAAALGDGFVLTGSKQFVPDAPHAHRLLVAAREPGGALGWYMVERDAAGLGITPMQTMDQTRPLYALALDAAPARRLGAADGFAAAWSLAEPVYWTALAAEALGGSDRVLEDSVAYAKERKQFGAPIGVNQAIKHRLADMLIQVEGARAVTYHAARCIAAGRDDAALAASMAKSYATEAYRMVAEGGLQVHGGVGFTWEYDVHWFYKRARALEITAGHADEHRERVAAGFGL